MSVLDTVHDVVSACGRRIERELAGEAQAFAAGDLELAARYAEAAEAESVLAFTAARCLA